MTQFKKFDVKDKSTRFVEYIEEFHQKYLDGKIPEIKYSSKTIGKWTKKYLGMTPSEAYERYCVKPIVKSLLFSGFDRYQAVELLEAMGVYNPVGHIPYIPNAVHWLVKSKLWGEEKGKPWREMRDMFIEPIIENLIRNHVSKAEINRLLGRAWAWVDNYVSRRWRFDSFSTASLFFETNYLGHHEVDDYLD